MLKKFLYSLIYKKIIPAIVLIIFIIACSTRYAYALSENFSLVVTADSNNNNIKLEWNVDKEEENKYTFKIFQAKNTETEFKPISVTNFVATTGSKVKVLNVYPGTGEEVEFTYKNGTKQTLPKSAMLKIWMEGGTVKYASGKTETYDNYGRNPNNNEQIIFVDLITIDEFNNNPDILNSYDVCMFGTWDYNGNKDLNEKSKVVVENYIKSGRGVLCGHDTIGDVNKNFWDLRKYFKIENYTQWDGQTSLTVVKKGLLTNFPWKIGNIGDKLTVPKTHNKQSAHGDIWIRFSNRNEDADNFYLTTYQNTAIIQTGHSDCNSTEDERKVIANTLFYLNQLTNDTLAIDNSGQDLENPNSVSKINNTVDEITKKATVTFEKPADNGTKYTYYVEATDKKNNKLESEKKSTTITTGIKGYNYIIDNNASTEAGYTINLNKEEIANIEIDWNKDTYLHIRSIDGAENYSETSHYKIEYKNIIEDKEEAENNEEKNKPASSDKHEEDTTLANEKLPQTGTNAGLMIASIIGVIIISIVIYKKYKSYKDIK